MEVAFGHERTEIMATYATAIKNPVSEKTVFVTASHRKHFFGWVFSGEAGMWFQASEENVTRLTDNDGDGVEEADLAALTAATPTVAGLWVYDWASRRLYYKPIPAATAFEKFVVGDIQFRFANLPDEDAGGLPFVPYISTVPNLQMRVGENFSDELGQTGSGSLGLANVDALFARNDFEPDGQLVVTEKIATYGGV